MISFVNVPRTDLSPMLDYWQMIEQVLSNTSRIINEINPIYIDTVIGDVKDKQGLTRVIIYQIPLWNQFKKYY